MILLLLSANRLKHIVFPHHSGHSANRKLKLFSSSNDPTIIVGIGFLIAFSTFFLDCHLCASHQLSNKLNLTHALDPRGSPESR